MVDVDPERFEEMVSGALDGIPVRCMVEQAGFADVTIQCVSWGQDTAVNRLFATVIGKVVGPIGGDLRLARGIKP